MMMGPRGLTVPWLLVVLLLLLIEQCQALSKNDPSVEGLIRKYWFQHKKYAVILAYLRLVHHVSCGMTWLKKKIKGLGLSKRGDVVYTPVSAVKDAIQKELKGVNSSVGYRQMWRILQTEYQFRVKRSTVMMLLKLLDPVGSDRRQRHRLRRRVYQNQGPNFVWHLDGYDKLTPYGFPIHACIDGVPTIVRSDCGSENSSLASSHMLLRHCHNDSYSKHKSYRYGSSTTNTRIESWWAQLRKSVTDYWINVFKDLIGRGLYNPNLPIHKHCLTFVYAPLLEKSLSDFKDRWNTHSIRANRLAGCPAGVPDDLYKLPQLHSTTDFKKSLDMEAWCYTYDNYPRLPEPFYPEEFKDAAIAIIQTDLLMIVNDISVYNAETVYTHLVNTFSA